MTQREVYDKLITMRKTGNDNYFTVPEIHNMLNKAHTTRSIQMAVKKLCHSRHIEYDADSVLMAIVQHTSIVRRYRARLY